LTLIQNLYFFLHKREDELNRFFQLFSVLVTFFLELVKNQNNFMPFHFQNQIFMNIDFNAIYANLLKPVKL